MDEATKERGDWRHLRELIEERDGLRSILDAANAVNKQVAEERDSLQVKLAGMYRAAKETEAELAAMRGEGEGKETWILTYKMENGFVKWHTLAKPENITGCAEGARQIKVYLPKSLTEREKLIQELEVGRIIDCKCDNCKLLQRAANELKK